MSIATFGLAAILAAGSAGICAAQDLKATQVLSDTQIGFDPGGNYGNYTLTVTGPNGFHATTTSKTGSPTVDLRRFGAFDDGTYHYQLNASTDEKATVRTALDNGRDASAGARTKGATLSGVFYVKGGAIQKFDPNAREEMKRQK
jgi:hypothetical protein